MKDPRILIYNQRGALVVQSGIRPLGTMSWDISIQDLPADAASLDDIPNDYVPRPLGTRSEMIARIQELLPDTNFSDPSWGMLIRSEFAIEFNMGSEEVCGSIMLHVRGGGPAMTTVTHVLKHLNLRGLDCQTGDFFSLEAAEASFGEWQDFRDRVIQQERPNES